MWTSIDNKTHIYFNMDYFKPKYCADELYIHAYSYYSGLFNWGHTNPLLIQGSTLYKPIKKKAGIK